MLGPCSSQCDVGLCVSRCNVECVCRNVMLGLCVSQCRVGSVCHSAMVGLCASQWDAGSLHFTV